MDLNPFDQFDRSAAGNPFDQFDSQQTAATASPPAGQRPVSGEMASRETSSPTPPAGGDPGSLWNSIPRGYHEVMSGVDVLRFGLSGSTNEEFARALVENEAAIEANPKTEAELNLQKDFSLGGLLANPTAAIGALGEGAMGMAVAGGGAVAGGFAGGPLGSIAGLGLGGAATTFGASFKDYLKQQGVNFKDSNSVELALADPDIVNEAYWYAAKQAGVTGLLTAITGKVGEGIATKFFVPGATKTEIAKGAGQTVGLGAGYGAAANVGSGIVAGQPIDPNAVLASGALGGLTAAPFAIPGLFARGGAKVDNRPPTVEETTAVGRVAVGDGKPIEPPVPPEPPASPPAAPVPIPAPRVEAPGTRTPPRSEPEILPPEPRPGVRPSEPQPPVIEARPKGVEPPPVRDVEPNPPPVGNPIPRDPRPKDWEGPPAAPKAVRGGQRQSREVDKEYRRVLTWFWDKWGDKIEGGELKVEEAWAKEPGAVARLGRLREEFVKARQREQSLKPWEVGIDPVMLNALSRSVPEVNTHIPERIDRAAVQVNGKIYTGLNHADALDRAAKAEGVTVDGLISRLGELYQGGDALSGFTTSRGRFVDRKEALKIAESQGQLDPTLAKITKEAGSLGSESLGPDTELDMLSRPGVDLVISKKNDVAEFSRRLQRERPLRPGEVRVDPQESQAFFSNPGWQRLVPAVELGLKAMQKVAERFGISGLRVMFSAQEAGEGNFGSVSRVPGGWVMKLSLSMTDTAEQVYSTIMHELGHVIMYEKFQGASDATRAAINDVYQQFLKAVLGTQENPKTTSLVDALLIRSNPIFSMMKAGEGWKDRHGNDLKDLNMTQVENPEYWWGFNEWFAERVSRWAMTGDKPLNVVDRFFKSLGQKLRRVIADFGARVGIDFKAKDAFTDWLDSYMEAVTPQTARDWVEQDRRQTAQGDRDIGVPGTGAPRTAETNGIRGAGGNIFGDDPPPGFKQGAAAADRFAWFYKHGLSLLQVAKRNLLVRPLQLYRETVQQMHREVIEMMNRSKDTLTAWKALGTVHAHRLSLLIDDYMNMRYLSPADRMRKVVRKPTQAELTQMITTHQVSGEGLKVFTRMVADFDNMLTKTQELLERDAHNILDPVTSAHRLAEIGLKIENMRKAPYFPAMRFGRWTMTIRDTEGRVVHFEQFTSKAIQRAALAASKEGLYDPALGFRHDIGHMPDDVAPFIGMPPGLLDLLRDRLELSENQKQALDQLKFELAPSQSFAHRFQKKRLVSGYSEDFMRAYANYFFHGSNYIGRAKYSQQLKQFVKDTRDQAKFMPDHRNRDRIANFMQEHLANNVLSSKADFVKLKSAIFTFALGFSPVAAAINLTQLFVGSAPFLTAKFGTIRGLGAMMKAGADLHTYYKEGKLESMTEEHLKALSQAIKDGVVTEAMAPQLAGVAEGRNLGKRFGSKAEATWEAVATASAGMFQLTEKANRRITFRAAFDLARANVNHPHVLETLRANELVYEKLRAEGWDHGPAAAYVVAKDAVETTQYVYSSYAKPRIFQGKLGSLFVFKSFLQNTLFMLWNHPDVAVRSVLVMGALGGLMGIPGTADLADLLKTLAFRLFGKDFDLDREVRQFVIDVSSGEIPPDLVLHGTSRRGFGIPQVFSLFGMDPPEMDLSGSVGIGSISPIQTAPLFGPAVSDPNSAIASTAQQASGAAFGVGFNIYKAMTNSALSPMDAKRWESAMPREAAALSRAWRAYSTGKEKSASGAPIAKFDPSNPTDMAEIAGMVLGMQPLKITAAWDLIKAKSEVMTFWQLRRTDLMNQMQWARDSEDPAAIAAVAQAIGKYNRDLPKEAGGQVITRDELQASAKSRARSQALLSQGLPTQKNDIGLAIKVNSLYPEATVGVQKVN